MSVEQFTIKEHIIPASFIRGYARGVRDETSDQYLRLSVKQYTPHNNPPPQTGDPTIIFTPGQGMTREAYEPMLQAMVNTEDGKALRVRAIWSIEPAHQGASYLLNEDIIGDEIHWFDHTRDILHTINHFQAEMKPPLIAIGHSMGAGQLLAASYHNPRLFDCVVAIEPPADSGFDAPFAIPKSYIAQMKLTAARRDEWPSREDACRRLRKTPMYARWDAHAFDLEMQFGLRDVWEPGGKTKVVLTTPKSLQMATDPHPDPPLAGHAEAPDFASRYRTALLLPGFYRSEPRALYNMLASISTRVLLVAGQHSPTGPQARDQIFRQMQSGITGDERVLADRVKLEVIPRSGHFVPLERPETTANVVREGLNQTRLRWLRDREQRQHQAPYSTKIHPDLLARIAKL